MTRGGGEGVGRRESGQGAGSSCGQKTDTSNWLTRSSSTTITEHSTEIGDGLCLTTRT